jgi:pSer/pThr/pTyr-binding forkhead associated (FHA) protein
MAGASPRAGSAGDSWLIAERGGALEQGARFDLIGGLSIGRSRDADVQIDDRYASGVHARIFNREGRSYVEDMNSTNGTLLNDATLKGEAELLDGDIVRIGDTEFRFETS